MQQLDWPHPRKARRCAALVDGENRKLLLQLLRVALGTLGLLFAEQDGLKMVSALFTKIFKNRHNTPDASRTTRPTFPWSQRRK